ncbi:MAG TPA: hypothetical protein VFX98_12215 [Longimicrobiaceae bacterium]|nr:hypothetical protein [Longimicrobiaceae bacterium]
MRAQRTLSLVLALLVLAACGGGGPRPSSVPGGAAPAVTVERFLRLAEQKEYGEMGYLFGNREGSVMERHPANEVEQRMYAIATVLEHRGFALRQPQQIPGRPEAVQVTVQLESRAGSRQVPFTVVRGPADRWYIEIIDLERITRWQ